MHGNILGIDFRGKNMKKFHINIHPKTHCFQLWLVKYFVQVRASRVKETVILGTKIKEKNFIFVYVF